MKCARRRSISKPSRNSAVHRDSGRSSALYLAAKYNALDLPESRWTAEFRDGFEIDRLRAHFIGEMYRAVLAKLSGSDGHPALATALGVLDQAKEVVARRHADLHDTH